MKLFPAADLSRRVGDVLDAAGRETVAITKHRKPRYGVMSVDAFEAMRDGADRRRDFATTALPDDLGAALDAALDGQLADQ